MTPSRFATLLAVSLTISSAAPAQSTDILLNCTTCHDGTATGTYPVIAGQPARYIERQLFAFRTGLRQHPQMQATAIALGDGDAARARMYADWPAPDLQEPTGEHEVAETLIHQGDWERGIGPCADCHKVDPQGVARLAPRLEGHPRAYLSGSLRAYAEGERRSDSMGRMRAIAGQLTQAEIAAIADYYAAFRPDRGTGAEGED